MPKKNIFDLTNRYFEKRTSINDEDKSYRPYEITEDAFKKMIVGYTLTNMAEWENIPKKSHIRYQKKNGQFMTGGFLHKAWEKQVNGRQVKTIILINRAFGDTHTAGNKWWLISEDSVNKLWVKKAVNTQGAEMQGTSVSGVSQEDFDKLSAEVVRLRNEQMRMLNFIKKLYNIK